MHRADYTAHLEWSRTAPTPMLTRHTPRKRRLPALTITVCAFGLIVLALALPALFAMVTQ
jgi:hypothetical protein